MKLFYVITGSLSLALGIIGIALPLLPTTPFVLLAAFCFSKGSERMHLWLIHQPLFGPMIEDWNQNRIIRRHAKILATVVIVPTFAYTLIFVQVPVWIKLIVFTTAVILLTFIWSQKEEVIEAKIR